MLSSTSAQINNKCQIDCLKKGSRSSGALDSLNLGLGYQLLDNYHSANNGIKKLGVCGNALKKEQRSLHK